MRVAQFDVFRNGSRAKQTDYPFLVCVQSDFTEHLPTCVVVPVCRASSLPYRRITRLMPLVRVQGESCVLVTQELAGIGRDILGEVVDNLSEYRSDIIAALDLLFTGA